MNIDHAKIRRESLRWLLLLALNHARPVAAHESLLVTTARSVYSDTTDIEVRRELGYLEDRKMVKITRHPAGFWTVDSTSLGADIAEYTVECHAGIARPEKYWTTT